jgi:vitamin K-dependent gamma-carboxylase
MSTWLMRPVDASTVALFRVLFGFTLFYGSFQYFYYGQIQANFIDKEFLFTYEWFPWIVPFPGDGMYYFFAVLCVSSLMIALGLYYRFASIVFFLTYTYFFLLDKAHYNNHYYFISLLGFLFCFIRANQWLSLDGMEKPKFNTGTVPWWNLFILKAQVFIVYFYGGIAKINPDWLRGEPMRHWLADLSHFPIVGQFFASEWGAYFFSYGGLFFDLSIGFILLYRKTRWIGFIMILIFNLTNNWIFSIGVFPFLMIGATILFLEPDTPRKWIKKINPRIQDPRFEASENISRLKKPVLIFVSIYLAIQILVPFRHWLYEGNVAWTDEAHNFSWRMKLRTKMNGCMVHFRVTDRETGKTWSVYPKGNLTFRQHMRMCARPHMIIQYAHHLGRKLEERGHKNPIIKVVSYAGLNYRKPQPFIDPNVNLMEAEHSTFSHADWILPMKE